MTLKKKLAFIAAFVIIYSLFFWLVMHFAFSVLDKIDTNKTPYEPNKTINLSSDRQLKGGLI